MVLNIPGRLQSSRVITLSHNPAKHACAATQGADSYGCRHLRAPQERPSGEPRRIELSMVPQHREVPVPLRRLGVGHDFAGNLVACECAPQGMGRGVAPRYLRSITGSSPR